MLEVPGEVSRDEKNCDYSKVGRKELRLLWENEFAAAEGVAHRQDARFTLNPASWRWGFNLKIQEVPGSLGLWDGHPQDAGFKLNRAS